MNHSSIKFFIIIVLVNYLVQNNVSAVNTEKLIKCVESIRKYYEVKPDEYPTPLNLAKYAFRNIRYSNEMPSGIKIFPPKYFDNQIESSSSQSTRGESSSSSGPMIVAPRGSAVKKVHDLDDLVSGLTPNQPPICGAVTVVYNLADLVSGLTPNQPSIGEDPLENIPDDVRMYYESFILHLAPHTNFQSLPDFCIYNFECIKDILSVLDLSIDLEFINYTKLIQKIYTNIVEEEVDNVHAKAYIYHASNHFKLVKVQKKNVDFPHDFCHGLYA